MLTGAYTCVQWFWHTCTLVILPHSVLARAPVAGVCEFGAEAFTHCCYMIVGCCYGLLIHCADFDDVVAAIIANDKDGEVLLLYEPDQEVLCCAVPRRHAHMR